MHTEKDKRVGGSISLILAVVALDVAWVGRDWLPHLADELGWAFVETDYRVLGIGGFGIEIELILRAPTYSPSTCGMHHMFLAPRLEGVFGQPPAHSLTGDTVVRDEPDEFTRQQLKRPAAVGPPEPHRLGKAVLFDVSVNPHIGHAESFANLTWRRIAEYGIRPRESRA